MKLPKTLYATYKFGARSSDNWIDASADKDGLVEEGGEIIGTYILQKLEVGETRVTFKQKKT